MKINPTKTLFELITTISFVLDNNTYHSWRVAIISGILSRSLTGRLEQKKVFYAALLHDIGGAGFPLHILHYLKQNNKINRDILLSHPIIGAQIISDIPKMSAVAQLIIDHHEWINGQGYPRGKTEKNIPWGSQAIRLADSLDILIQKGIKNIPQLRIKTKTYQNKEYPSQMASRVFALLKKNSLFKKIINPETIPFILFQLARQVGQIPIPKKIDAIGKAMEAIAEIIDMKHPFTLGHSTRVSRYALAIAMSMGLNHDEITAIRWAGLIHDIGKLMIPRRVLDKNTKLTCREYQMIQRHAKYSISIMKRMPSLQVLTPLVAAHHEHFDGTGYPSKLKGEQIPLGARIISLCDAFDAMTSNRPYRQPLNFSQACEEIKRQAEKQFDPQIVKIALPLLSKLGF